VTIAGETHRVPIPSSSWRHRTDRDRRQYPLPEAQVDRFMMKVLSATRRGEEFVIVERGDGRARASAPSGRRGSSAALCASAAPATSTFRHAVRGAPRGRDRDRREIRRQGSAQYLSYGASPRASIHLIEAARASPSCAGATTRCPRTSSDLRAHVFRHRWCFPTRRSPRAMTGRRSRGARDEARPRAGQARCRCKSSRRVLSVLRRLEWSVPAPAGRPVAGRLPHALPRRPRFADLREYQYGDDVRHIDWNVTARLQTPYVREYHADREITPGPARFQRLGRFRSSRWKSARFRRASSASGAGSDAPRPPHRVGGFSTATSRGMTRRAAAEGKVRRSRTR